MTSLVLDLDRCPFFFIRRSWTKKITSLDRSIISWTELAEEEEEEHAHMRLQSTSQLKRG